MQNIYVTAPDIDFSRYISAAFTYLAMNPDFHSAMNADRKAAICNVANAMCNTRAILLGWEYRDHFQYLMKIVTVSDNMPDEIPDVCYVYRQRTKQVH
jgi:hypothetical protein